MTKKTRAPADEATADAVMGERRGLSTGPAQRLSSRAREFDCETTIETLHGKVADAKDLLQVLLLGVEPGGRVKIRCRGPQAVEALEALVECLAEEEEQVR